MSDHRKYLLRFKCHEYNNLLNILDGLNVIYSARKIQSHLKDDHFVMFDIPLSDEQQIILKLRMEIEIYW